MKKKLNPLLMIILLVAGVFVIDKLGNLGLFAFIQEDYKTWYRFSEDGIAWEEIFTLSSYNNEEPNAVLESPNYPGWLCARDIGWYPDRDYPHQPPPGSNVKLTATRDFFGEDLRLELKGYQGCNGGAAECGHNSNLYLNDLQLFTEGVNFDPYHPTYHNYMVGDKIIDIDSSKVDSNQVQVRVNGAYFRTIDLRQSSTPGHLWLSLGANFLGGLGGDTWACMREIMYEPQFSCQKGPNDMFGFESFAGGQSFRRTDLRYPPKSFCRALPVVVTQGQYSGFNEDLLDPISEGELLYIPPDQTWTIFYIFENDGSLPVVCEEAYYDFENERCTNLTGITYLCSEGQFDPLLGACVVQPESLFICELGRYDTNLQMCIWNPPLQPQCEDASFTYNEETGLCEKTVPSEYLCEDASFTYNPDSGYCEKEVPSQIYCQGTYNPETGMCLVIPETEIVCEGTYNPQTGICTVVVESQYYCQGTYNPETGECVYYVEPTPVCDGRYDYQTETCYVYPNAEFICPDESYIYNPYSDRCEKYVTSQIFCDGDYDSQSDICYHLPLTEQSQVCLARGGEWDSQLNFCRFTVSEQVDRIVRIPVDTGGGNIIYVPVNETDYPTSTVTTIVKDWGTIQYVIAAAVIGVLLFLLLKKKK